MLLLLLLISFVQLSSQKPATKTTKTQKPCSNSWFMCRSDGYAVCGSDKRTYANRCHLNQQQCYDTTLLLLHHGACMQPLPPTSPTTDIIPTPEKADCEERCDWTYRPICASNGVVYRNLCWIEHARRCYDPTLKVLNTGFCGNCVDLCTRMEPRPVWLVCPIHQSRCHW